MDSLIGIRCKNFVIIVSDTNFSSGMIKYRTDADKFYQIKDTILAYSGDQSEAFRLCEYVTELSIYQSVRHEIDATPKIVSNLLRNEIHKNLRKKQIGVGCLICGPVKDLDNKIIDYNLFMVDAYGALLKFPYICLGYASYFGCGILDQYYKNEMTVEEAIDIVKKIINVLKENLVINYNDFMVKIVNESGTNDMIIN